MNPFEELELTNEELELIDAIEFDSPSLITDSEALAILARMIISFKVDRDEDEITSENIQSLSYLFNKFLGYVNLRRIDFMLIEMFLEGDAMPSLNNDDEWEWMLTPKAEDILGLDQSEDEE